MANLPPERRPKIHLSLVTALIVTLAMHTRLPADPPKAPDLGAAAAAFIKDYYATLQSDKSATEVAEKVTNLWDWNAVSESVFGAKYLGLTSQRKEKVRALAAKALTTIIVNPQVLKGYKQGKAEHFCGVEIDEKKYVVAHVTTLGNIIRSRLFVLKRTDNQFRIIDIANTPDSDGYPASMVKGVGIGFQMTKGGISPETYLEFLIKDLERRLKPND